jgi:hypothetical protein
MTASVHILALALMLVGSLDLLVDRVRRAPRA